MGLEIEAKMRLRDTAAFERKLLELGAVRGPVIFEINTFFDTPVGTLKSADRGLRIRIEREIDTGHTRVAITHKGPRAHGVLKSRMEHELVAADAEAASELLQALGYIAVLSFEKRRRRWLLNDCHVEIDQLPHLGEFVEIEGPTEDLVMMVREKLGLTHEPLIKSSYIAMLMSHLSEHNIRQIHVGLEDEVPLRL